MFQKLIAAIGGYVVRLVSSSVAQTVVREVTNAVIDDVELTLRLAGYHGVADTIDLIQQKVNTPERQRAILDRIKAAIEAAPTVVDRAK